MNTIQYIKARINKSRGMGGFLNPPTHPEHTMSVETDLTRRPENRGSMSLSYALKQEYISPILKEQIKALLDNWEKNKLPLESEESQQWIEECIQYFGNHKAIAFIKEYYPSFIGKRA